MTTVVCVAGEASGDRAAAGVVSQLVARGADVFGMGGTGIANAGGEVVADLRETTAVGFADVARRSARVLGAFRALVRETKRRRPRVALLVNYTEMNMRLAARLRALGISVVWYIAPQIWAWREGRASKMRELVNKLAVVLPFEEGLWRTHGVEATYVGHPIFDASPLDRGAARTALGLTPYAKTVAIMPGSRPHEVTRLLPSMLAAYEAVRRDLASVDARVLLAPSLDDATTKFVHERARALRVPVIAIDGSRGTFPLLSGFDAALTASGTASLEAALARAVPVVCYRIDAVSALIARALLRVKFVALPNVLLGRGAFAELLQGDANASAMGRALRGALGTRRNELLAACDEVSQVMTVSRPQVRPAEAVTRMIEPFL